MINNEVKEIQQFKPIELCVSLCLFRVLCVKNRVDLLRVKTYQLIQMCNEG